MDPVTLITLLSIGLPILGALCMKIGAKVGNKKLKKILIETGEILNITKQTLDEHKKSAEVIIQAVENFSKSDPDKYPARANVAKDLKQSIKLEAISKRVLGPLDNMVQSVVKVNNNQ